jgi:hypothetical protein
MKVHLKTFQLLQKYEMWPVFSLPGTAAEASLLWDAGVGYTQFSEYWTPSDAGIGELYNLTEVMVSGGAHSKTQMHQCSALEQSAPAYCSDRTC